MKDVLKVYLNHIADMPKKIRSKKKSTAYHVIFMYMASIFILKVRPRIANRHVSILLDAYRNSRE